MAYHKQKRRVTTRLELHYCGCARRIQKFYKDYRRKRLIAEKYALFLQTKYRKHYAQKKLVPLKQLYSNSKFQVCVVSSAPTDMFILQTVTSCAKLLSDVRLSLSLNFIPNRK